MDGTGMTSESAESGLLYVVATPIGNLGDITLRALEVLRSVDLIAAEDTRHTRKLLTHFDIHKPLVSYHGHNFQHRGPQLIEKIREGTKIALVTDAGTPGISDPGTLLVRQAIEEELSVVVIPGPTALITALVASGLPTHPFAFLGFPPAKGTGRRRFFASYGLLPMTLILYESPQRLNKTLEDMLQHWGNRPIAVARELTKRYEEFFRGTVEEAKSYYFEGTKGELTLVVGGADSRPGNESDLEAESEATGMTWQEELRQLLVEAGMSVREASERVARRHGLPKRMVYQEALRQKEE
jgi:16S rRNA (cytidine1402-2'-O)-methyltransferase